MLRIDLLMNKYIKVKKSKIQMHKIVHFYFQDFVHFYIDINNQWIKEKNIVIKKHIHY